MYHKNIRYVLDYYNFNRRVGHTTAMLNGAKSDENIKVLVHNKKYFDLPQDQMISINEIDRLRGNKKPLLIDHCVFGMMISELFQTIQQQEDVIEKYKRDYERQLETSHYWYNEAQKNKSIFQRIKDIFK